MAARVDTARLRAMLTTYDDAGRAEREADARVEQGHATAEDCAALLEAPQRTADARRALERAAAEALPGLLDELDALRAARGAA